MILVTGGTGFLGSHLLFHLLQTGEKVRAIRRETSDLGKVKEVFSFYTNEPDHYFAQIDWVVADLTDLPALEKAFTGINKVYHCAALVSFDPKDYRRMRKANIECTENVVNLCITEKVEKLCFVSSIATLEKSSGDQPIDEENYWSTSSGKSGYAITKHGAETEVWRAGQEGLDVVIVNPGVIIGSGFWHSGSSKIFDKIYKGLNFYTEGVTGFVDVIDVVKAMMELTDSPIKNQRYVLVAENLSFKDFFYKIAGAFGIKPPSRNVSKFLMNLAWRLDGIKSAIFRSKPLLTKDSAEAAYRKSYYSSEKIKKELGFTFRNIDETVQRICADYLRGRN